jgi:hypothetical protein
MSGQNHDYNVNSLEDFSEAHIGLTSKSKYIFNKFTTPESLLTL